MAQSMTLSAADAVAIEALIVEHNWRTDHAPPGEVADLYEENCVVTGLINAQGREALRRLAEQVSHQPAATSSHHKSAPSPAG